MITRRFCASASSGISAADSRNAMTDDFMRGGFYSDPDDACSIRMVIARSSSLRESRADRWRFPLEDAREETFTSERGSCQVIVGIREGARGGEHPQPLPFRHPRP